MKCTHKGFTLIELLVVIAIIGLLSSIVLASLNTAREKARVAAARQTISEIRKAVEIMGSDTGVWPGGKAIGLIENTTNNEIWDLTAADVGLTATDGSFADWRGPYIREIPTDPWGHPYFFDTDYQVDEDGDPCQSSCTQAVAIGSFGPNGFGQNLYDSDDIILIISR